MVKLGDSVNMQDSSESNPQASSAKRRRRTAIFASGLLILLSLVTVATLNALIPGREPPTIVMRVDDIQDFAFREAQLFLLDESLAKHVPLSLSIIAGVFGEDKEIVRTVKAAINSGSDVTVHGWKHEDLAKLTVSEQLELLNQSKSRIKEVLDFETSVLAPPLFSFNDDTLAAMRLAGFDVVSTSANYTRPGTIGEVISLPTTVELSRFLDGTWYMKSANAIEAEISLSIQKYGFAVILTHPQEYIKDGKLDRANTKLYRTLLSTLKKNYSFETLGRLSKERIVR